MKKPLEGVRVIDLTQAYSGPFCTMHLADQGAEVIKVEPPFGDQSRTWGPMKNEYSAYYAYINRNKKGIAIDLKKEEGREILTRLIRNADVLCENFKVGTMEKLGFPYEKIKEINPGIIYGSISGFGLDGPLSCRPAYDIVAQAMSGIMDVTGYPDQPSVKVGPSIGDNYSGTFLSLAICMGLYQREKTGKGMRVDVSMLDTLFSILENFVVTYTVAGEEPKRMGNIDPGIAPFDSFEAADGRFVMGCGTDRMWAGLCDAMDRPDLLSDPRYATNNDRVKNYLPDLKRDVEDWTKKHTVAELEEIITAKNIPFGRINSVSEACGSEQLKVRNMLWNVHDPGIGEEIEIPGTPIKIRGTSDSAFKAAPMLGEDTEYVLSEIAGYDEAEIKDFKDKGAVY